jgi:magnesium-protoporphyrin O-methyltransferase
MQTLSYQNRRSELELYFDRTAADAWSKLTSDAPVGRIRATVRAGRDRMRASLLDCLPADLRGRRILDAGCGTGALAVEAARRGADVVATDLSATLLDLARARQPKDLASGSLIFRVGDMRDASLGRFDHVVAMDSLIHYRGADMVDIVAGLAARADRSVLFTFAPKTPLLATMHAVGRLFPRGDRAPAIEPIGARTLLSLIGREPQLAEWRVGRSTRIAASFYISQMLELVRQ